VPKEPKIKTGLKVNYPQTRIKVGADDRNRTDDLRITN